jgi:hypothetical protein
MKETLFFKEANMYQVHLRNLFLLTICLTLLPFGVMAQQTTKLTSIPNAPDQICPLPIGSAMPKMQLQGLDAKPFDLAAAIKAKPTILIYFRGGW